MQARPSRYWKPVWNTHTSGVGAQLVRAQVDVDSKCKDYKSLLPRNLIDPSDNIRFIEVSNLKMRNCYIISDKYEILPTKCSALVSSLQPTPLIRTCTGGENTEIAETNSVRCDPA